MITKIIAEELIQKAKKYVEKGESFAIVTHVSPDGDALGSSLGLYHFLTAYGKDNVSVIVPTRWYVDIARRLMIQGVELRYVWRETLVLLLMAGVLLGVSWKKFKIRLE